MPYEAGNVVLKFVTDLSQARRDLEAFRAEAAKSVSVGGATPGVAGGTSATARGSVGGSVGMVPGFPTAAVKSRLIGPDKPLDPLRAQQAAVFEQMLGSRDRRQAAFAGRTLVESYGYTSAAESVLGRAGRTSTRADDRRAQRVDDSFDRAALAEQKATARAEEKLAKAKDREARAAEKNAALEEERALAKSQQLKRATLRADAAMAPTAGERVRVLEQGLAATQPGTVDYEWTRRQLGMARRETLTGSLIRKFGGIGAGAALYFGASQLRRGFVDDRDLSEASQYGTADEQLNVAEEQARRNRDEYLGAGSWLRGKLAKSFPNWFMSDEQQLASVRDAKRSLAIARGSADTAMQSTHRRFDVDAMEGETRAGAFTDDFERGRAEAKERHRQSVSRLDLDRLDLEAERKATDSNDPRAKVLDDRLKRTLADRPMQERAFANREGVELAAVDRGEKQRAFREVGVLNSIKEALERHPLASQIAAIEGDRQAEEVGVDPTSGRFRRLDATYRGREYLATQDYNDRKAMTQMGMDTRRNRLDALMGRSQAGAAVADIVGTSRAESLGFEQVGEKDFARQSLKAGIDQLRLMSQQYGDGLQGRQLGSKFELDTGNVAGDTPATILRRIELGIQEMTRVMGSLGGA